MHALFLMMTLAGAPAPSKASGMPSGAVGHGIHVQAPAMWVASMDGTTFVFSAPTQDASLRVDLYEKPKAGDAQTCLDEIVHRLAASEKTSPDSYTPTAVGGQPAATQTTFTPDRKQRTRRIVGCNGKSYFLIDWVELTHAGPKYAKAFTQLLTAITYARP